jgi:hypothetical protein
MKRWRLPVLVPLLVTFFLACFTWEYTQRDTGYSREARLNPWLAVGRLLEANGLRVRMAPEYGKLPPQARVLVLATPLEYLDLREQSELLSWVQSGGHLIVDAPEADAREDSDLIGSKLDTQLRRPDFDDVAEDKLDNESEYRPLQLGETYVVQAGFSPYAFLEAGKVAPRWSAKDKYGTHALRFMLGDGRVTLLSDHYWLSNRSIGEADHAALLWAIVDARRGDEVWLVHGIERPSLFALVREAAAPFLLALAGFVLVWLWAISRRFGPLGNVLPRGRRRLTEHLEASGRYLLRHGGLGLLYDASRQRLLAQVQRRYPQWRRLPSAELATHLAARARLESGAVLRVLESGAPDQLLQFAADIRLINRLRKAL